MTLIEKLQRAKEIDANHQGIKRLNRSTNDPMPLSFAQERFWFLDQLNSENPLSNRTFAWKLTGPYDHTVLTQAISAIIERHSVFRTAIVTKNNRPEAVLHPPSSVEIPLIDLTHQPESIQTEIGNLAKESIGIDHPLLLKGSVLKLDDQIHIALFVMHHVAFDALSEEIFKHEFSILYESYLGETEPKLPPLPIQLSDFAHWQREHLTKERLAKSEAFWIQQLEDAPQILPLPHDHPRPETHD